MHIHHGWVSICLIVSTGLLTLSFLITFVRLLKGPSLPDRVIALDNMSMIAICVIAVFAIIAGHPLYLDIVIALAMISFLGMVAFSQYIEWQLGKTPPEQRQRKW